MPVEISRFTEVAAKKREASMFQIGELVVYGGEGVCRVESIGVPAIAGMDKQRQYYTLQPLYRSGQVLTPVDTKVLMRPIMTAEAALAFIAALPDLPPRRPRRAACVRPRSTTTPSAPPTTAPPWRP